MRVDYNKVYAKYIYNGEPIPYKDILIYPVMWNDAYEFLQARYIIDMDGFKENSGDKKILKMSYLEFVLVYLDSIPEENREDALNHFVSIFRICLRIDINKWNVNVENDKYSLAGEGKIITSRDFDIIRKIILYQNIIDYDDSYIDPDVKQALEDYYRISNKDVEPPTFERKKAALMSMGYTHKDLQDITYREGEYLIEMASDKMEYMTDKIIRCIPYVDSKKIEINHWLYKKHKDKFAGAFVDAEGLKAKYAKAGMKSG